MNKIFDGYCGYLMMKCNTDLNKNTDKKHGFCLIYSHAFGDVENKIL